MDAKLLEYNCLDSACTLQCKEGFWPDLMDGFLPAYDMTLDLFPVLMFLQTRGIKVDMNALVLTRDEIVATAATKQEELNLICGRELNVNSSKDCQQYFYIELGIPPYLNEGKVTVDDLALQRLSRGTAKRPGLRQAKLVQEIRGLQKLHGTYLNIEFDADERMRCSYNPRGTKFGRLSSSKTIFETGTNNQNLPQEFKRFLVADTGYTFWEVDKRQAEWVVVAYLTGDANMISAVERGQDIHVHTASLIFGVDHEVVELEGKLVGNNTDPDIITELRNSDSILAKYCGNFPRTMSARQCGKKSNHGFNYDEGPNKWALINEVELAEGKRIHAMYHQIYPGIRVWYQSIQRQLQRDRCLTNCFGRKVRFMGSWDLDLWKAAYSFLPQSSVVDSLNQGMVKVYNDPYLCNIDCNNIDILAQVHDSILMQVPIPYVNHTTGFEQIKARVYDYVSPDLSYNNRSFKIATDSKMGFNWGGKSKTNPQGMREVQTNADISTLLETLNEQGT
jgi:DNA polymerase I-like protein with 3'-5' exonuclease and polymerase domains